MIAKIVVGTDGFGPAGRAVARAAEIAAANEAELIVVAAYPPGHTTGVGLPEADRPHGIDVAEGSLRTTRSRLGADIALKTIAREGEPAEALLDVAEEEGADLIVVGSVGMSKRLPLGVVPNRVSHHAGCHVLIVKTEEG